VVLLEVIASNDIATIIFRSSIFLLVVGIGILLIRSVIREVKQREELQKLTTELANANEKLKALDLARAEFISIASHQLRTPPATIKWYLAAILAGDYGKLPEESEDPMRKALQTTNSLISLIEDLLNVSRIERGTMEFLFEQTDLKKLAQTTFDQLFPIAHDKKLDLSLSMDENLPLIMADREKLRQVMNNLIDNSIKYTKTGKVEVKLQLLNGNIRFSVTDTGKGIAPEDQDEIFQKFKRGKESIKQSAGLGLGLYVAKIIIEQHRGKIWAESPGEGQGSTFLFEIPLNNHLEKTTLFTLGDKLK
jgi:signal transduction histidine kinase